MAINEHGNCANVIIRISLCKRIPINSHVQLYCLSSKTIELLKQDNRAAQRVCQTKTIFTLRRALLRGEHRRRHRVVVCVTSSCASRRWWRFPPRAAPRKRRAPLLATYVASSITTWFAMRRSVDIYLEEDLRALRDFLLRHPCVLRLFQEPRNRSRRRSMA